ncbi:Cyclin-dependent protein kinase inhibitor SMR1 [Rhynchospora pubera]|uniref:Cyclin-dependent protein kinase inhibitor SMR1 n=1 Tax=Rhynchospora pubera TaxID=906938 RepID=A0AAV8ARC7_9POAL|nr:Cyclin-dependent protein kinase inhibitor SMR1 [Rhynchospora pubera]KAJ4773969.1 Cyclin-dependent protein kinase inhibitor SMR1 [Rhynchospora pubera]KAJ4777794.1 Cyclin-dependent protein kinase inhibitor SMR1 [Rhynchospora pubera]KAJ4803001.1 Cyclin-dependent protein kinase inhibitor SMR1 [Rhynchospora pubera]
MATSPEYSQPTTELVDDNTITFFPLDDLTREKKGEEECRTPTGEEYRLVSVPETCPPAPRKKSVHSSCKKRLMEVEILSVRFEEVEEWFCLRNGEAKVPSPLPLDSKVRKLDAGI